MAGTEKVAMICTKGTLDWAYPPFILGSTAVALDKEVSMFFTFYGLNLLLKDTSKLRVSPAGNPGMPMKLPYGPEWLRKIDWAPKLPNLFMNNMPGFEWAASKMMLQSTKNHGVASVEELREMCQEFEVKFLACQMTVELFGYEHSDFIDGVEFVGASTFFDEAGDASKTMTLYL
ncbi:MAG: peroxiredoxin family protein [Thiotrichales bacterium]|jgi:peroxiredoxin family protein|nr:peroxiredoxin family protein [Thiotrichales bacterium]MBT3612997.1 peroxiredoxin family protein [Thiotrichales bacterium]MBT3752679.1 peroxiredoxin family protein [Thiotrichales bacterium]MBT3837208.1 peroxiredoxin family protein [Thiotrichales bacterium]MBT4151425.1 peroxiredoxin family protein [Thiotrichales bacterium]